MGKGNEKKGWETKETKDELSIEQRECLTLT